MKLFIIFMLASLTASTTKAQQYLDSFQYKGSHNAYERGEHAGAPPFSLPYGGDRVPLDIQIGAYGVFMVEFDFCLKDSGELVIKHDCTFLVREYDIDEMRDELFSEPSVFERVTWIYLDIKSDSCCDNWDALAIPLRQELVWNWFTGAGQLTGPDGTPIADMVYTASEWKNANLQAANYGLSAMQWPTMDQLVNKNKHFIISWNRDWDNLQNQQIFLDYRINPDNVLESIPQSAGIVNYSDEDLIPSGISAGSGDRPVLAAFPTVYWDDINADGWNRALNAQTNYIRTNNITALWSFAPPIHHPFPLYINNSLPPIVEIGTRILPFRRIQSGLARIEATVPRPEYPTHVQLNTGIYNLGNDAVINTPVKLQAKNGPVVLTD